MNKTIKVIDLLNKIANGEKVPKRIKYCDDLFALVDYGKDTKIYQLLEEPYEVLSINTSCLNDIVEIIEDNNKLEKIKTYYSVSNEIKDDAVRENLCDIVENLRNHEDIINEIINHINRIEEKLDEEER